jgi:predicted MFS family arabinose efflux permease
MLAEEVDVNRARTMGFMIWVSTVGWCFTSVMPIALGGLVDHLGFTAQLAGWTISAHLAGMMFGALVAFFTVSHANLRLLLLGSATGVLIMEISSAHATTPLSLGIIRFADGTCAGMVTSVAASAIASVRRPERAFAVLFAVQSLSGALGLACLPCLLNSAGMPGVFYVLAAISLPVILLIKWFPASGSRSGSFRDEKAGSVLTPPLILALTSLFVFYLSISSVWVYLERIAVSAGIAVETVGTGLGLSLLAGMAGALFAFLLDIRVGRGAPLTAGILGMIGAAHLLMGDFSVLTYSASVAALNFCWTVVVTYYLGLCSILDDHGRGVVLANFIVATGLAAGPGLAAALLGDSDFDGILRFVIVGFVLAIMVVQGALYLLKKRLRAANVTGNGIDLVGQ